MDSKTLRQKYLDFFAKLDHQEIQPASLLPANDPTTLFTSSGMQPLVPYLMGQTHPSGKRLVDSQPSLRVEDIEEVGDNRHTTFFEMLGNWSLGDYFKKEQLAWYWQFLTEELKLPKEKLYVSVFEGEGEVPKDEESFQIWKDLGVEESHINFYGSKKNWWSRSGPPEKMPVGEIGGPDSEVFYEFNSVAHDPKFGEKCHPNCDCGRFLEIGNSVFIEYKKGESGFEKLPQKNVDFGGGLERTAAALNHDPDIFKTDLYAPVIQIIEDQSGQKYADNPSPMRIVADHLKAAVMLIAAGVEPANKLQGYVLRRLLRRAIVKSSQLTQDLDFNQIVEAVFKIYQGSEVLTDASQDQVSQVIQKEIQTFSKTLEKGLREFNKNSEWTGKVAFDFYQTYGFPKELFIELAEEKGHTINLSEFETEFKKHQEASRSASAGMFKGGLAEHSEVTTKYHTATHLLHQALRDVLGPVVLQRGSNITGERLRFDFSFDRKLTEAEVIRVEEILNQRIKDSLEVEKLVLPIEEAKEKNAIGLFGEKYDREVSIYGVGPLSPLDPDSKDPRVRGGYYSLEFCGGPHVKNTSEIGSIKITKEESISQGVRRIRAILSS